jgi:hypothetical protein
MKEPADQAVLQLVAEKLHDAVVGEGETSPVARGAVLYREPSSPAVRAGGDAGRVWCVGIGINA